jgi:hypothetical protein
MTCYATFGGFPCVDPINEYEEQSKTGYDTSWASKAISFACPVGPMPGKGYLLLLRRDLDNLDINERHDLVISSENGNITIKNLLIIKAVCLTPGMAGDKNSCYLVEVIDKRWSAKNKPIEIQVNILAPNSKDEYYKSSINPNTYLPWTWEEIIRHIWETNDTLGEFTSLPYTPSGTPQGYQFLGVDSYDALNVLLAKIHCSLRWNPQTDIFDIVEIGAKDNLDQLIVDKLSYLIYDAEVIESNKARVANKVRVYFNKVHMHYGQEISTSETEKQWITDSIYYKEFNASEFDVDESKLDSSNTQVLWDDLKAVVNYNNSIENDTELETKAREIATKYYKSIFEGGNRLLKKYSGIHNEFNVSGELKYVTWKFTTNGVTTEIARTIGFIDGMDVVSQYMYLEDTENLMAPDFSRATFPNYFPQLQLIEILEGPIEGNYYRGQITSFNVLEDTLKVIEECWVTCPDTMTLQTGDKAFGKIFGKKQLNTELKQVYYVLGVQSVNAPAAASPNILLNIKNYVPILEFSNYDYYEAEIIAFDKDQETNKITPKKTQDCYAAVTHLRKPELNLLHPGVQVAIINSKGLYKIVLEHVRFVKPLNNVPIKGSVYNGIAYGLDYNNEGPVSIDNNNFEDCYINDLRCLSVTPKPGTPPYKEKPPEDIPLNPTLEEIESNEVASPNPVWYTSYFHLGEIYIEKGQEVTPGQLIATIGSYENGEPHLHFSLGDGQGLNIVEVGNTVDVMSWLGLPIVGTRYPSSYIPTNVFSTAQKRVIQSYFNAPINKQEGNWRIVLGSQFHVEKQYFDMDISLENVLESEGKGVYNAISPDTDRILTRVVGTGDVAGQDKNLKFIFLQHEIKSATPAPLATIDYLNYSVVEGEGFTYKGALVNLNKDLYYIGRYQGILDIDGTIKPSYAIDPDYICVGTRTKDTVTPVKKIVFEDNNFDVLDSGFGQAYVKGVLLQNHGISLYRRKKINFKTEVYDPYNLPQAPFLAKDNPTTQATDVIFYKPPVPPDGGGGGGGLVFISYVFGTAPILVDNSVPGISRVSLEVPLKVIYGGTQRYILTKGATIVGNNIDPVALIPGNPYTLYNHKYNYNYPFPEWTIWSKIQGVTQTGIQVGGGKTRPLEIIETGSDTESSLALYFDKYDNRVIVISAKYPEYIAGDYSTLQLDYIPLVNIIDYGGTIGTIGIQRVNNHSNTLSEYEIIIPEDISQRGTYPYVYDFFLKDGIIGIKKISEDPEDLGVLLPVMFEQDIDYVTTRQFPGYVTTRNKIYLENIVGLGRGGATVAPGTFIPHLLGNEELEGRSGGLYINQKPFQTDDIVLGYTYKGRLGYLAGINEDSVRQILQYFGTNYDRHKHRIRT